MLISVCFYSACCSSGFLDLWFVIINSGKFLIIIDSNICYFSISILWYFQLHIFTPVVVVPQSWIVCFVFFFSLFIISVFHFSGILLTYLLSQRFFLNMCAVYRLSPSAAIFVSVLLFLFVFFGTWCTMKTRNFSNKS